MGASRWQAVPGIAAALSTVFSRQKDRGEVLIVEPETGHTAVRTELVSPCVTM